MSQKVTLKKALIDALKKTLGVVTPACDLVGIDRRTYYRWMEKDPKFNAAVKDIENIALDFAESQLHKQIKNGEVSSTIFYLKTKGKSRGYIERNEQTGADGEPLNTNVTIQVIESDVKFAGSEKEIDV